MGDKPVIPDGTRQRRLLPEAVAIASTTDRHKRVIFPIAERTNEAYAIHLEVAVDTQETAAFVQPRPGRIAGSMTNRSGNVLGRAVSRGVYLRQAGAAACDLLADSAIIASGRNHSSSAGLEYERGNLVRVRDQRDVAGAQLDRGGVHALCHEALEVRINGAVLG
jgi:hypothetical protein